MILKMNNYNSFRLFTQVCHYSEILGPSSSTPTLAQQLQVTFILPSFQSGYSVSADGAENWPAAWIFFRDSAQWYYSIKAFQIKLKTRFQNDSKASTLALLKLYAINLLDSGCD
jgi:hypothetical protein